MTKTTAEPVNSGKAEPGITIMENQQTTFSGFVGINEAAKITHRSKGQISQDTKSGRLSYEVDERGYKRYMVAELERVYGLKTSEDKGSEIQERPQEETTKTAVELAVLRERLKAQEEMLRHIEEENRALRQDKEYLREQNQQLTTRLLPAPQTEQQPVSAPQPIVNPQSWWRRLFS